MLRTNSAPTDSPITPSSVRWNPRSWMDATNPCETEQQDQLGLALRQGRANTFGQLHHADPDGDEHDIGEDDQHHQEQVHHHPPSGRAQSSDMGLPGDWYEDRLVRSLGREPRGLGRLGDTRSLQPPFPISRVRPTPTAWWKRRA